MAVAPHQWRPACVILTVSLLGLMCCSASARPVRSSEVERRMIQQTPFNHALFPYANCVKWPNNSPYDLSVQAQRLFNPDQLSLTITVNNNPNGLNNNACYNDLVSSLFSLNIQTAYACRNALVSATIEGAPWGRWNNGQNYGNIHWVGHNNDTDAVMSLTQIPLNYASAIGSTFALTFAAPCATMRDFAGPSGNDKFQYYMSSSRGNSGNNANACCPTRTTTPTAITVFSPNPPPSVRSPPPSTPSPVSEPSPPGVLEPPSVGGELSPPPLATPPTVDLPTTPPAVDIPTTPSPVDLPATPPTVELPGTPPIVDIPAAPPATLPATPPAASPPAAPSPVKDIPSFPPTVLSPGTPSVLDSPPNPPAPPPPPNNPTGNEESSVERSPPVNEDSSVEDSSAEDSSAEDSSAEDSSAEDSSAEDSSAEESSAEDSSAEDSSAEDSSVEDSSAEDSSVEESSLNIQSWPYETCPLGGSCTVSPVALVADGTQLLANTLTRCFTVQFRLNPDVVSPCFLKLLSSLSSITLRTSAQCIGNVSATWNNAALNVAATAHEQEASIKLLGLGDQLAASVQGSRLCLSVPMDSTCSSGLLKGPNRELQYYWSESAASECCAQCVAQPSSGISA